VKIGQRRTISADLFTYSFRKKGISVSDLVTDDTLNKRVNQNFEYFCKMFLFLWPRLKDEEAHSVYQKFVESYLNGNAALPQQTSYKFT
jgi:hypothetical protein